MAAELYNLQAKEKKRASSIWTMKKAELVEVARQELGLTLAKAEEDPAPILRQRIKDHRDMLRETEDVLDQVPIGLGKMKLLPLIKEAEQRGLPVQDGMTRTKLQMMIRDDVQNRRSLYASRNAAPNSSRPTRSHGSDENDWQMTDVPAVGMRMTDTDARAARTIDSLNLQPSALSLPEVEYPEVVVEKVLVRGLEPKRASRRR